MFATFIALIIAVLHFFDWVSINAFETSSLYVSTALFSLSLFISTIAMIPLKSIAKMTTTQVIALFRNDTIQILSRLYLTFFLMVSIVIDLPHLWLGIPYILAVGLALDATLFHLRRALSYFDPSFIIHRLVSSPPGNWDVYDQLHPLYEMAYKAITASHVSLCENVLQAMEEIARKHLLKIEKNRVNLSASGVVGELDYFLGDFFQHLDPIMQESIVYGYEPVINKLMVLSGKIAIHVSQIHNEESTVPLHFLANYAELAVEKDLRDVGVRATITLQTVARVILQDGSVMNKEIKEVFYTIIHHLNVIAKALFSKDKSMSIVLLCDPFRELKKLFNEERIANHPDKGAILGQIEVVLAEFDALEKVMNTIPAMPFVQDKK